MATLQGVYPASVLDNRDPEGVARVLVRVSGLDAAGVWARVATMMAGPQCGTWFVPAVGDEVLVAFERGDPRAPYVIGALWNGKTRPPEEASDAATTKTLRSRSGVTFRIRDDNTSLVIETPGGQRVSLQDRPGSLRLDDGNGNAVTLAPAGVSIQASGTVTISAAARVEIKAVDVAINTAVARFAGVVQCDRLISNAVVSASYSPGVGNIS
jgi:uncharacterized protein involved in type VI secretion and phage assembly